MRILFALFWCVIVCNATPTTITDVLLQPNGSPDAGVDVTISQSAFFSGTTYYPAWTLTPHPVTDAGGNLSVALEPNPAGQLYTVTLKQPNGVTTSSCWNVPASATPLTVKQVLSSSCGTPPLSIVNIGQIANFGSAVGMGPYSAYLPNPTYPPAYVINSTSSGDVDLYTVPANRRALLVGWMTTNPGSFITSFLETKIGASYYRLTANSINTGAAGNDEASNVDIPPRVLNAGETMSIHMTGTGLSTWVHVIEFDATSPLRSVTLTSPSLGHNTLYTVPAGKTFEVLPFSSAQDPNFLLRSLRTGIICSSLNPSGLFVNVYAVPKGSSTSTSNIIASTVPVTSVADQITLYGSLAPGDFLDVQVTAGVAAGQMAWMNIIEH